MKKFILRKFNFALFDGEGAASSAGAEGTASQQTGQDANKKEGGEIVIYGKQPTEPDAAAQAESSGEKAPTLKELRAKYDEFMTDENMKKFMSEDTQKVINRRFRENKAIEEQLAKQNDVISRLVDRYGVNDMEALANAIDNDSAIWEEAAYEAGMSVEQFRNYKKMERQAKAAETFMESMKRRQQADAQYETWIKEAEALKEEYPEFDLNAELQNPTFRGLLGQKNPEYAVSMKQIYEVSHPEVLERRVAQRTAQQVTDNIKARGQRPVEGAARGQSGIVYKSDVSKLTKNDRKEIAKRVLRGEAISF